MEVCLFKKRNNQMLSSILKLYEHKKTRVYVRRNDNDDRNQTRSQLLLIVTAQSVNDIILRKFKTH